MNIFDNYELKARIFPAVLTAMPFGVSFVIWYPDIIGSFESSIIFTVVILILLFSLAKVVRERGKRIQNNLLDEWGDFPTTIILKYSDDTLDVNTKKRYHRYLNSKISEIKLPTTKEQELKDPKLYNGNYRSAVRWLLEKARDHNQYPLVYQENINYGFSRNLLGMKYFGVTFSILSFFFNIFHIYWFSHFSYEELLLIKVVSSLSASLIFLGFWVFFVKKDWVTKTAWTYAEVLLSICEGIN